MSQSEVEKVIGRAVTDTAFRAALLKNAREACKEYQLSDDELGALENLDEKSMASFAGSLDERISKKGGAGFIGG